MDVRWPSPSGGLPAGRPFQTTTWCATLPLAANRRTQQPIVKVVAVGAACRCAVRSASTRSAKDWVPRRGQTLPMRICAIRYGTRLLGPEFRGRAAAARRGLGGERICSVRASSRRRAVGWPVAAEGQLSPLRLDRATPQERARSRFSRRDYHRRHAIAFRRAITHPLVKGSIRFLPMANRAASCVPARIWPCEGCTALHLGRAEPATADLEEERPVHTAATAWRGVNCGMCGRWRSQVWTEATRAWFGRRLEGCATTPGREKVGA